MEQFNTEHLLAEALVSLEHFQVVNHLHLDRLGGPARGVGRRHGVLPLGLLVDVQDVQVVTCLIGQGRHALSGGDIATVFLPAYFGFGLSRNLKCQFIQPRAGTKV